MRVDQPVLLTADLYGKSVTYHGRIAGFGAGTGSAFALLPAQNATGNWIKIVQRVPVRVALDPEELKRNPLQIGLSMRADVDTHDRTGPRLPELARTQPGYSTDVFQSSGAAADVRVREIISSNNDDETHRPATASAGTAAPLLALAPAASPRPRAH
jgi:membrane fusion protein (multidrug efflux system)